MERSTERLDEIPQSGPLEQVGRSSPTWRAVFRSGGSVAGQSNRESDQRLDARHDAARFGIFPQLVEHICGRRADSHCGDAQANRVIRVRGTCIHRNDLRCARFAEVVASVVSNK